MPGHSASKTRVNALICRDEPAMTMPRVIIKQRALPQLVARIERSEIRDQRPRISLLLNAGYSARYKNKAPATGRGLWAGTLGFAQSWP
jgi:hypothetical protein